MRLKLSGDRLFFLIVTTLVIGGLAIFTSASLGFLARPDETPWKLALTQLFFGLIPGYIALVTIRFMPARLIEQMAVPIYIATILFTLAVFIPGVGETINGARRWINLGITTIQPSEFLKIGTMLMLAWYLARIQNKISDITRGLLGFMLIIGVPSLILLLQPNTSTVLVIGSAALVLYIIAGAPWRDIAIIIGLAACALLFLVMTRPYLMARVQTFFDPSQAAQTSGYQIQQSLIAIGSGGIAGRGFGQSVQKFNYLPEPVGDSVFAVFGEEFGFIGTVLVVLIFIAFATRGLAIAGTARSAFGAYLVIGLTLVITFSAFLNIGAMLGIAPLTGLPLPFVSHGGTALLAALISIGFILNVAANRTRKRT